MPTAVSGGTSTEPEDGASDVSTRNPSATDADKTVAMATVMIETFGTRALAIAQEQIDAATPDQPKVVETWQRIAALIRERLARQNESAR